MYYDGEWNEKWEEEYEISLNNDKEINLEERRKLELDEFVYDMHTSEGKKRGKSKEDFKKEGCFVVNENEEYLRKEWKNFYVNFVGKPAEKKGMNRGRLNKKELKEKERMEKKEKEKRERMELKEREKRENGKKKVVRKKKSKKDELIFVENRELLELDESEIRLCSDVVCGNKVVCFEYQGKIYKEGRKSMNYNLDYYVFDRCKEFFGLN